MPANPLQNLIHTAIVTGSLLLIATQVSAVEPVSPRGRYFPLSQNTPPGRAARLLHQQRGNRYYIQPVKISLPTSGSVGVFVPGSSRYGSATLASMSITPDAGYQIGLGTGNTYRLRLADIPSLPHVELFPSIEILDRLHPPATMKHDFPIPIVITEKEIMAAASGQLVTKAIYLEQPQLAAIRPSEQTGPYKTVVVSPKINLLAEADQRGRPLAILRIGSRKPVANSPNYGFFGNSGPVEDSYPSGRMGSGRTILRSISHQRASRN